MTPIYRSNNDGLRFIRPVLLITSESHKCYFFGIWYLDTCIRLLWSNHTAHHIIDQYNQTDRTKVAAPALDSCFDSRSCTIWLCQTRWIPEVPLCHGATSSRGSIPNWGRVLVDWSETIESNRSSRMEWQERMKYFSKISKISYHFLLSCSSRSGCI